MTRVKIMKEGITKMVLCVEISGDALDMALYDYCNHLRECLNGCCPEDKQEYKRMLEKAEIGVPHKDDFSAWLLWQGYKATSQNGYVITGFEKQ